MCVTQMNPSNYVNIGGGLFRAGVDLELDDGDEDSSGKANTRFVGTALNLQYITRNDWHKHHITRNSSVLSTGASADCLEVTERIITACSVSPLAVHVVSLLRKQRLILDNHTASQLWWTQR